jgi:hypothetical protein
LVTIIYLINWVFSQAATPYEPNRLTVIKVPVLREIISRRHVVAEEAAGAAFLIPVLAGGNWHDPCFLQ